MVGRSGAVSVCVKITPSDASNPSGTAGLSGFFTVNNIAYNETPIATTATPAGVQTGNVQINYFLADVESDTCSIAVLYSKNDGTTYQAATMGSAGDGLTGLSSSPSGTAHVYLWDSRADNVALSGQMDTIRIRITPTDFNTGTAGDTNSFSVDNSIANNPPTITITGGPAEGSTVPTTQVTFTWSGSDTDGSVVGYYYSFDQDPPDIWTTDTSVTSSVLSEGSHTFRVVAMDDDSDLSTVASRTFTVSISGTITAEFSGSPLSGTAPLTVNFTDLSTATNGIDTWSWDFGNGDTSTAQHPSCSYMNAGSYTVSLTVTGPDGSDPETKTSYITVTSPSGDTIYVDGVDGDDGKSGLDWANAVKTIQTGLDKASSGWMVLVADGTYTGADNRNLDFAGKAIHLKSSSGAEHCHIDCGGIDRAFYLCDGETATTIIEGFTIEEGDAFDDAGGGIRCLYSSPLIRNCIIRNNAAGHGGGMAFEGGQPMIVNCLIEYNTGYASSGGIYCFESDAAFTGCILQRNRSGSSYGGGGLGCQRSTLPTLHNCIIRWNISDSTGGGIRLNDNSRPRLTNCLIYGNSANYGGGIYLNDGGCNFDIINSVVHDNTALNSGGALAVGAGVHDPVFSNTIIYSNLASSWHEFSMTSGCTVYLRNCCYDDSAGGTSTSGTFDTLDCTVLNPDFQSALTSNYRLQASSPCINGGGNGYLPGDLTEDMDNNPRIFNTTVDIGAFEYGNPLAQLIADFSASRTKAYAPLKVKFTDISHGEVTSWAWDFDDDGTVDSTEQHPQHEYATAGVYTVKLTVSGPAGSDTEIKADYINVPAPSGPTWKKRYPENRPGGVNAHMLAYDSNRNVIVLYGGHGLLARDDTWEWDGTNWTEKFPADKPYERWNYAMAYDSTRGETVLFGGYNVSFFNDTWVWDGTNWTEKFPANKPSPRDEVTMAFDATRGAVILFGGQNSATRFSETWEWNGTNWLQRFPANSPSGRGLHAMAYDSGREIIVLHGGYTSPVGFNAETWEWNGTNWTNVTPAGTPGVDYPSPRAYHAMAYHAGRGEVVMFGGMTSPTHFNDETWEWNGTRWIKILPLDRPSARANHAVAYNSATGELLLFGGYDGDRVRDDTWEY
jgi:PKD repeat protein